MKERFRKPNVNGSIKIKLSDEKGYWVADKNQILAAIVKVCEEYQNDGYTLTLRQLYYQLVSKDYIPNHDKVYKKMSSLKDEVVYGGIVDWKVFEDGVVYLLLQGVMRVFHRLWILPLELTD